MRICVYMCMGKISLSLYTYIHIYIYIYMFSYLLEDLRDLFLGKQVATCFLHGADGRGDGKMW